MKHKREASRPPISENVSYKCIKSKAELEENIDGSKSIKALISRVMKKPNKKRNPVAKQLRHFTSKIIKNKKIYDRKNKRIEH
jgi:hypothetical protein